MKVTKTYEYGKQIVVLQRGWVYVGDLTRVGNECKLKNAYCIRRWGTTNGLGQLAMEGPQAETKLEPCPIVRFHYLTMVNMIECDGEKWKGK